jgi:hypothetical protein
MRDRPLLFESWISLGSIVLSTNQEADQEGHGDKDARTSCHIPSLAKYRSLFVSVYVGITKYEPPVSRGGRERGARSEGASE